MSPYKKSTSYESLQRARRENELRNQRGTLDYDHEANTPKESIQPDFLNNVTGIDPDEEKAMEDSAHSGAAEDIEKQAGLSPDALAEKEAAGGSNEATQADKKEGESAGLFNQEEDGKTKRKGRFSPRRKAIAGGGVGLLVGVFLAVSSVLQGPGQIIHFAQLLQKFHFTNNESFKDSRTGKFFAYLRTVDHPERRNLGRIGNKAADRYEKKLAEAGITMDFDKPSGSNSRRIQKMTVDTKAPKGESALDNFRKKGLTPTEVGDGVFEIDLRGTGGTKDARKALGAAVETLDLTNVGESVGKRVLTRRARIGWHYFTNKAYEKSQDYENRRAYDKEIQEDATKEDLNGVEEPDGHVSGEHTDSNGDGTVDESDVDTTEPANRAESELSAAKEIDSPGKFKELKAKWEGFTSNKFVKGVGYVGAAVGIICAAKGLSKIADSIEYANIILPLIRIGVRIVAMANQVMSGQGFNIDELGAIVDTLHSDEFGSWASARSIQAENKQPLTGLDINEDAKPSKVGEKPIVFQVLDNEALDQVCNVNDTIGKLPVIKQIGDASDQAINLALKPFGWSTDQLMRNLASLFAAKGVQLPAFGAVLGNYANYGARLAANDSAIASGGRALSGTEVAELDAYNQEMLDTEFSHEGVFARYLDLNEPRSLAAKALFENNALYTPKATFASLLSRPLQIFSPVAAAIQPKVSAEESYDYGFPEYGFSLEEQNDPRLEDPLANADLIEPRLATLNDRYGKCFSMTVKPDDGSLINGQAARYDEIAENENCTDSGESFEDGTTELLRYRMYVADMVNTHSLACYEGAEDSCRQIGFSDVVDVSSGTVTTPGGGKIEGDPYTDSSSVNCAEGTDDLGLNDGYKDGVKFTVRLCSLPNLPSSGQADNPGNTYSTTGAKGFAIVNSRVSGAWFALIRDMKASGITNVLVTSSFRSMQHQTDLFNANPDPNYVARPGYSSHQAGVALDFAPMSTVGGQDCGAGRARADGDPTWDWLYANADRYGFKQYSAESWHWDALPTANRCGPS